MDSTASGDSALNAARRERELADLIAGGKVDLAVIGGGFTGAGVALDATTRGLSVALVERGDLASGTSSWSSKLAHGGLRYLAKGDIGIAWESAVERGRLMKNIAPHLIRPLPMVFPLHPAIGRIEATVTSTGFHAGDVLRMLARTPKALLPHPRRISAASVHRFAPTTDPAGLRGGLLSWDGQLIDDARLVVALARTAAQHGADILTYTEATAIEPGHVHVRDRLTGDEHTIGAKQIVNAAGVWSDTLAGDVELAPSKGSHILVPAARLGHPRAAITAPVPGHFGRYVFAVPWHNGLVMIGLTDDPHHGPIPERDHPDGDEAAFLLDTINAVLEDKLTTDDIVGGYSGFRPLIKSSGASSSADLSRKHALLRDSQTGALTIVGGKLTTYRRMAEDAVDAVVEAGGLQAGPCRTTELGLVGKGTPAPGLPDRLVTAFGTEAAKVAAYGEADPSLNEPVREGIPLTGAEVRFAVEHELALTVEDVIDRRTRWGLVDADRAELYDAVVRLAPELNTDSRHEG
ncbi:glycerol-3-phosphate dehydrogenase [Brevibacterium siliguriense]|uniref:Glycerol-3-phosphate dehydrogenase n=1 Tax=Brevibacterium siliguriense TaxID=1136497 RepID=A0A1H1MBI5_9MICO|nr:glycerol-3-phosphate dehydrogenase/oxidase [Brevibacterium siliguriense]SDR84161.1 glycerol-3-phosphate dehydrogenase [Brevibacterium siliguriense]